MKWLHEGEQYSLQKLKGNIIKTMKVLFNQFVNIALRLNKIFK